MPVAVEQQVTVWRWKFHSVAELRKALEEYTAIMDTQLVPSIGREPGDGADPDPARMDTAYRVMAQNREIDRHMLRLEVSAPLYHRLLDTYYRHGLSVEAQGWRLAARRCGLPAELKVARGREVNRPQFEVVLDLALTALFHAH